MDYDFHIFVQWPRQPSEWLQLEGQHNQVETGKVNEYIQKQNITPPVNVTNSCFGMVVPSW